MKKYKKEIDSLINFAQDRFQFFKKPKVLFLKDEQNASKLLGKTGYYDPNTQEIYVYVSGRHPKDVLRSIAHELVHHMQNEKGILNGEEDACAHPDWSLACVRSDGGEDYMGPGYAQKNPHLRNMERQAYEMGNLCFRDWEDGLKEQQPTIYNERRIYQMSTKKWKNNELNNLLMEKWGFKMNLNEMGYGHHEEKYYEDPMGLDPELMSPMGHEEVAMSPCEELLAGDVGPERARQLCAELEGGEVEPPVEPPCPGSQDMGAMERDIPFQEGKKKKLKEVLQKIANNVIAKQKAYKRKK